ncbi:MAG: hypothetical protein ABI142_03165 [Bryocella sp.]
MDPNEQVRQMMQHMGPMIFFFWGIIFLVKITLYIIPLFQTCKKAGISPGIAFLAAIPLVGRLLAMYVIAFSQWRVAPIQPMYPPQQYPPQPYPTAYQPPPSTPPPAF